MDQWGTLINISLLLLSQWGCYLFDIRHLPILLILTWQIVNPKFMFRHVSNQALGSYAPDHYKRLVRVTVGV